MYVQSVTRPGWIAALMVFVILTACQSTRKEYRLKVKLHPLSLEEIYNSQRVEDAVFEAQDVGLDSLRNAARTDFLKGIDAFKNKRNPTEAISCFKRSLLILPDAKTYYELGNALIASGINKNTLDEAEKAYEIARVLNFKPLAAIAFQKAIVYYQYYRFNPSEEREYLMYQAVNALRESFREGFPDTLGVKQEPLLEGITAQLQYQLMLTQLLESGNTNSLFGLFLNAFPEQTSYLSIAPSEVGMEDYRNSINYDFASFIPEMENVSFGRDVSHDFFYVAKVAQTTAYAAVIYGSVNFYGEDMQPVNVTLATYSPEGKMLDHQLIGCQCSASEIKTFDYRDGELAIHAYKRIWEHPLTEVAIQENKVQSHELLATARYRITEEGNIEETEKPAEFPDSALPVVLK